MATPINVPQSRRLRPPRPRSCAGTKKTAKPWPWTSRSASSKTDKANVDVPATVARRLQTCRRDRSRRRPQRRPGDRRDRPPPAKPGAAPASAAPAEKTGVATSAAAASASNPSVPATTPAPTSSLDDLSPAVRRMIDENKLDPKKIAPTGPGGRLTKEDVIKYVESSAPAVNGKKAAADVEPAEAVAVVAPKAVAAPVDPKAGVTRTPMSKIRKRIAENLVRAQQTAAILTTFNEVDLTAVMALRTKYKEQFAKKNGIGLGFMSFFATAVCMALQEFPKVNGQLDGDDVITYDLRQPRHRRQHRARPGRPGAAERRQDVVRQDRKRNQTPRRQRTRWQARPERTLGRHLHHHQRRRLRQACSARRSSTRPKAASWACTASSSARWPSTARSKSAR